jgi:hypothetical protein
MVNRTGELVFNVLGSHVEDLSKRGVCGNAMGCRWTRISKVEMENLGDGEKSS